MKNVPLVSIIIPVYKVPEEFLRVCVESCINQTMHDIEVILIDDGSPDKCGEICDEYAKSDERIKVIHQVNAGPVAARNAGFNAVTAPWHMYLDGDDYISDDALEGIFGYLKKYNNVDIVFWNYVQELNGKLIQGKWGWLCKDEERLYLDDECKELARHTMIYSSSLTTVYAKLINTKWAKANNLHLDNRLRQPIEGYELCLRLFYYAKKALFINRSYNIYRYVPTSLSKMGNDFNSKCTTDCFRVIEEDIETFTNKDEVKRMFYQRVVYGIMSVAFSTYFHPLNKDCLRVRLDNFEKWLNSASFYKEAISKCPLEHMDKLRIIILYVLKMKMYFLFEPVSRIKQFFLKRGWFNY